MTGDRIGSAPQWENYSLEQAIKWYDQWGGYQGVIVIDAGYHPRLGIDASGGIEKKILLPENARNIIFNIAKEDHDGGFRAILIDQNGYQHSLGDIILKSGDKRQICYDISTLAGSRITLQAYAFGAGTDNSGCDSDAGKCCFEYIGIDSIEIKSSEDIFPIQEVNDAINPPDYLENNIKIIYASDILKNISYKNHVNYDNCVIKGDIDLEDNVIDSPLYITNSIFEGDINFKRTKFNNNISFYGSHFLNDVHFEESVFSRTATFTYVYFYGFAFFKNSQFNNDSYFNYADFSMDAYFSMCKFSGYASFLRSQFLGDSNFDDTEFQKYADFKESNFVGLADYSRAIFIVDADFIGSHFSDNLIFNESKFYTLKLNSISLDSDSELSLTDSGITRYDYSNILVDWNDIRDHLSYDEVVYLSLIRNFKDLGVFDDAYNCYYQYRRESQSIKPWKDLTKYVDILSGLSCGYGVRPSYPLAWSCSLVLFFGLLFWSQKSLQKSICPFMPRDVNNKISSSNKNERSSESISISEAIYFSTLIFFHTHPPAHWYPSGKWKFVVVIEDIAGWLFLAIFVVVLVNRIITW